MQSYSVLMSVYYKEKPEFLLNAIESMLHQTVLPEQFVIVEDGQLTEELNKIIDKYETDRPDLFTIVRISENRGLGLALDEGIAFCRNELIARMDSDDIAMANRCEKELKVFARNKQLDIVSGAINEFKDIPENIVSVRRVPEYQDAIEKQMKRRSAFNHPAVMFKKSSVIKAGGYGTSARKEDHDLFSRMVFGGCNAYNLQDAILYYRISDENIKRRKSWKNVSSYIEIMWINLKRRYCSLGDFLYVVGAQIFYLLAPISLVQYFIKKYFRSK